VYQIVEQQIKKDGVKDSLVFKGMQEVPHHKFVPENLHNQAYDDSSLPIRYRKTISPLLAQLKEGGKIVIPVSPPWNIQSLWVVEKTDGDITTQDSGAVRFVPLT